MLYGLKEMLKLYNVKAVKSLSQNFIFDQALLKIIVSTGTLPVQDTIAMEIGPAAGNLSRALLSRGYSKIVLIEKDVRFKPILEQLAEYSKGKIQLKFNDALNMESSWIPSQWTNDPKSNTADAGRDDANDPKPNLQIIGNLPFGVATPITLNLIKLFSLPDHHDKGTFFNLFNKVEMILLFQDEVARKFCAKVGSREYGRLAVMAQAFSDVQYLFKIDNSKFSPKPKVDSGLVKFSMNYDRRSKFASDSIFDDLESLTNDMLRHKNKKIKIDGIFPDDLGINPNLRPLHLTPENFIRILQAKKLKYTDCLDASSSSCFFSN